MPQSVGELEYEQQPRNQERSLKKKEKKWTLGSLFRRKKPKDSDTDSSDSDAVDEGKKGGFLARRRRRRAANRGSKDVSQSFEHVILRPNAGGNITVEGKKSLKARVEASRDSLLKDSSSEEECSPRTKPRAPRSKRSSRDMTDCNMKVLELDSSPRSPRWTAKVVYCESSDYEARYTAHTRSATPSPAQSPIARVKHLKRPPIPQSNAPRPLHCQKSASFDILPCQSQQYYHPPPPPSSHNHQHNQHYHQAQLHPRVPPPPPPRDPQRKIIPPLGYLQDRPLSYAFESNQPLPKVMTDHNSNITAYKVNSSGSLDHQPVYKMNSSGSLDHRRTYQYYTDQQPRSRRPIHITRVDQPYLSDSQVGRVRTSDWRLPRDSNSSLCDSSDSREGGTDIRPLSMVVETTEQHSLQQHPQPQDLPENKEEKRKSSNLEDALNELEAIYKSLQLRDEEPPSRGFESDSGYYRVVDDMAYRRLNRKESGGSPDCRRVMSQAGSYLLVSPTLSPPPFANAPPIPTPQNEPDITLDDVVYRNIRHTNNTLKVADPQPLFGIPVGPVAPAPNSDYLHATPKQLYRPTFKPRKTPDIVKDDLAYRSLRKDGQHDSLLTAEDCLLNETPTILKKKRAVRSLSANLLSIIQKEQFRIENQNNKNFNYDTDGFEKTQSYSDLPDVIDTRYKKYYSTEDSDVTPRVSRLYPDMPISTTSTETLTDSRTNIMNTQESCSSRNQYIPSTNKPLPKTDFVKLRLPSPSPQQSSPPKKFLQNVDSTPTEYTAEKLKPQKLSTNQINKTSSPNSLLQLKKPLNSFERNKSESPSPYYSASESPVTTNGNQYLSMHNTQGNKLNKNNLTSVSHSIEVNLGNNRALSPSTRSCYDSFPQRESNNLLTSENGKYYNGEYGKLSRLNTNSIEDRRCVSQSPRIDDQKVKSENRDRSVKSSPYSDMFQSRSLEKPKTSEGKSQTQSSITSRNSDSTSRINHTTVSSSKVTEDFLTDLSPVPLNPPKISIKERVTANGDPKNSTFFSCSNEKSSSNSRFSNSNNDSVGPKVTENKISIEGVKLVLSSDNKKIETGNTDKKSTFSKQLEQFPQNSISPSSSTKTSNNYVSKPRVPSPQISTSPEKSHQKIESNPKSSSSQYLSASSDTEKNNSKNNKDVLRPRSSLLINNSSLEKNKTASPRPRSSVTHDTGGVKPKIPSPNTEKDVLNDRVTSKSSSPRLYVETKKPSLPSPQLLSTPEKSPVNEGHTNLLSLGNVNFDNSRENIAGYGNSSNTSVNITSTKSSSPALDPVISDKNIICNILLSNDNLVNSCIEESRKTNFNERLSGEISDSILTNNRKYNESVYSDSDAKCKLNENENLSSPYVNNVSKENSPFKKSSSEDIKGDNTKLKTSASGLNIEKDIDQLLTEINNKQGEILLGKNKNVLTDISSNNDKKDCLVLGKITPHKPVKLTTFSINDNNAIENSETLVLPNRENEIIGSSESMTDLLRELTRSLDQDFGCLTTKEKDYQSSAVFEHESDIERTTNKSLEKEILNDNSKSSDSQELNNTDEADNEVMEINRVVLEQNKNKSNCNNEHVTGFVVVKRNHNQTIGIENNKHSEKFDGDFTDKKVLISEAESGEVVDKQGYCSDDSNAEFVEAICKTASELSALSSTSNAPSTSGTVTSSQQMNTDSTANKLLMSDVTRRSRPPQSHAGNLEPNEGERS